LELVRCGLNTTGTQNTAIGTVALTANTTGANNIGVGTRALFGNTTGSNNLALAIDALRCNTTGALNTAVGLSALCANVEGDQSTAVGYEALKNQNPVGNADMNNVAVGFQAALCTTTGTSNTAVGAQALCANSTGVNNVALGRDALRCNTTASCSAALGFAALASSTGGDSVAVGAAALFNATTGSNNIGIGAQAGRTGGSIAGIVNITTESNRIVMGNDAHTCAQIKVAWTATSDCRDKTCFKPIAHGLDFVRALKPTEYQFKQGGRDSAETDGKRRYGFLAQDILPLEGDAPVIISADNPEKLQYTESHLIPILVKAIQDMSVQIETLTARLEELENNA
jgi:trimeric autotransporter adhesin